MCARRGKRRLCGVRDAGWKATGHPSIKLIKDAAFYSRMGETQGRLGEFSENPELSKEEQAILKSGRTIYSHSRLGTFEQCH